MTAAKAVDTIVLMSATPRPCGCGASVFMGRDSTSSRTVRPFEFVDDTDALFGGHLVRHRCPKKTR